MIALATINAMTAGVSHGEDGARGEWPSGFIELFVNTGMIRPPISVTSTSTMSMPVRTA